MSSADAGLERVVTHYTGRAETLRIRLRVALCLGLAAEGLVAPIRRIWLYYAVVGLYAVWLALSAWWLRRLTRRDGGRLPVLVRLSAVTTCADLAALVLLVTMSGGAPSLVHWAFFVIPVLAALSVQPGFTAAVAVLTGLSFLAVSLPYVLGVETGPGAVSQTFIRFGYLCFVGLAATLLSWVQHERVLRISGLLKDRSSLLADAMAAEERERGSLAETLHDGVLQNVLAIRHLVQEATEEHLGEPAGDCLRQADRELGTVADQLRSTVFDLHPAVLEEAGLAVALRALARRSAARGGFTVITDLQTDVPSVHQQLLFGAARELLANVVRHARAGEVGVALLAGPDWITLTVRDDGDGLDPAVLRDRVSAGHIGLASYQVRVESAGGTLTIEPALPRGTRVAVTLPVRNDDSG